MTAKSTVRANTAILLADYLKSGGKITVGKTSKKGKPRRAFKAARRPRRGF